MSASPKKSYSAAAQSTSKALVKAGSSSGQVISQATVTGAQNFLLHLGKEFEAFAKRRVKVLAKIQTGFCCSPVETKIYIVPAFNYDEAGNKTPFTFGDLRDMIESDLKTQFNKNCEWRRRLESHRYVIKPRNGNLRPRSVEDDEDTNFNWDWSVFDYTKDDDHIIARFPDFYRKPEPPAPPKDPKVQYDIVTKVRQSFMGPIPYKVVAFRSRDNELSRWFRQNTDLEHGFYRETPEVEVDDAIRYLAQMKRSQYRNDDWMKPLIAYLEEEFKDLIKIIDNMLAEGKIAFKYLWYVIPGESEVAIGHDEQLCGGKVIKSRQAGGWFNPCFEVTIDMIKSNGIKFYRDQMKFSIPAFDGVRKIADLAIRPMTPEIKAALTERGRSFVKFGKGVHHCEYSGNMLIPNRYKDDALPIKAKGRMMADGEMYRKMNPNMIMGYSNNPDSDRTLKPEDVLKEEVIWTTWPRLMGFSLRTKKWGEFFVAQLGPAKYNEEAYDQLVLPAKKKRLVRALVEQNGRNEATNDLITGKGGGCIFLLHGPPGVGKTLTSEAVAEVLHRPLYSVSVGELGINPGDMEKKLKEILEVGSVWNAVILIDEADIFMEKRGDNDIMRNAMVSVFLRELEYHNGVLFLTTNRVKSFDPAFMSRINVKIGYPKLDADTRAAVWRNLLDFSGFKNQFDVTALAVAEINGRQIRNCLRLAKSTAELEGIAFDEKLIISVIEEAESTDHFEAYDF